MKLLKWLGMIVFFLIGLLTIGYVICLLFFGLGFLILFFGIIWPTRCKSCKKFFAITKNGVEFLGSEEVSVKVQHEVKNLHGDVTGTVDQYVPGTRSHYRQNYVCKYCGTGYYQDYSNSRANV